LLNHNPAIISSRRRRAINETILDDSIPAGIIYKNGIVPTCSIDDEILDHVSRGPRETIGSVARTKSIKCIVTIDRDHRGTWFHRDDFHVHERFSVLQRRRSHLIGKIPKNPVMRRPWITHCVIPQKLPYFPLSSTLAPTYPRRSSYSRCFPNTHSGKTNSLLRYLQGRSRNHHLKSIDYGEGVVISRNDLDAIEPVADEQVSRDGRCITCFVDEQAIAMVFDNGVTSYDRSIGIIPNVNTIPIACCIHDIVDYLVVITRTRDENANISIGEERVPFHHACIARTIQEYSRDIIRNHVRLDRGITHIAQEQTITVIIRDIVARDDAIIRIQAKADAVIIIMNVTIADIGVLGIDELDPRFESRITRIEEIAIFDDQISSNITSCIAEPE